MASTFENDLRLEEIGTGEQSGTWGATTNTNLELIAEAFSYGTEAITTNADTHATVIADGSTDEGRSMYLKYTGTLDSTCTITISAGSAGTFTLSKVWLIENATSGGQDIIITSGSGASITIKNGQVKMVASDGAGSGGIMYDLLQDVAIPDLFIDDDLTFQSDGAIINFGENSEIQLTHVHDTGLLLTETGGGAPTLQFRDSAISISSSADATLDLAADGDINLTAGVDINIPANVGLTFGNDGEKIEGDGTDLTIAGNNINLTASEDVVIPANIGILFGTGEKIEGDNTDLTITSGAKINLTATTDVHLPNNIGLVFGDTGEKIEGDGTNLAINSSGDVNITATTVDLDGNLEVSGSITLGSGAVISEAELETIDGVTAGTVSASKALVVDSNKKLNELTIDDVAIDGKVITMTGDTSDTVTITAGTNGTLAITTTDAAAAAANITITADGTFEAVGTTITLDSSGGINLETDALSIGNNGDTDVAVTFNGNSNDGVITWMEDEDYFQFSDNILMSSTQKIQFRDTDSFIHSSADGTLTIDGEAIIDLNASTRVDVSVDIKVGGEVQTAKIAFTDGDDAITVADGGGITAAAGITSTAASNTFGATSFNDANITNVADIALDSISADGTDINIAVSDNSATALTIKQGSDAYLIIDTANSSESVSIGTGISGTAITIGHSTSEVTVADNLTVNGDLTVSGTTTTVNSTTVNLNDHNIVLDSGNSTSAVINGAGITIEGGSGDDATFTYNTTGPKFELKLGSNHEDLQVDGLIASTGTFSGILKTDDTTDATSTTDGSLQTDGGLSVVKKSVFGDDITVQNATPTLKFTDTDNNYDATIQGLSGSLILKADSGAEFGTETIQFNTGGSQNMTLDASGNLGIGPNMTSPSSTLAVETSSIASLSSYAGHIVIGPSTRSSSSGDYSGGILFDQANGIQASGKKGASILGFQDGSDVNSMGITFNVHGTDGTANRFEAMRIDSSGNVGIGTNAPSTSDTLHVKQASGNTGVRIETEGTNGVAFARFLNDARNYSVGVDTDDSFFIYDSTGSKSRFKSTASETVINEDSGDINFRVETDNNVFGLFVDAGNDHVCINTGTDHGGVLNIETTGNSANLVLACTDTDASSGPVLELTRDNSSAADSDEIGVIRFKADNSANSLHTYANIGVTLGDVTDGTEDGTLNIQTIMAGTSRDRMTIRSSGVVFNEESQDTDFRVESDSSSHMLFLDASADAVGIAKSAPTFGLDVGVPARIIVADNSDVLTLTSTDTDANTGPVFVLKREVTGADDDLLGRIRFDGRDDAGNNTTYARLDTQIKDASNGSESAEFTIKHLKGGSEITAISCADDQVTINEDSADLDFRVEGNGDTHLLFVDGGEDRVSIGTSDVTTNAQEGKLKVRNDVDYSSTEFEDNATLMLQNETNNNSACIVFHSNNSAGNSKRCGIVGGNINSNIDGLGLYGNVNNRTTSTQPDVVISSTGQFLLGKTAANNATKGFTIEQNGGVSCVIKSSDSDGASQNLLLNRQDADGTLVLFRQANNNEGTISVSGSTVSYNGFSGLHESSGIPTDTPIGTVVSTIDELDVYSAKQGDSEEDSPKAGQTRKDHAKVKVSDTVGDKAVYGVVGSFNEQGKVNVASVGIGSVRVTGACVRGDLLESNGDGTAKVQSDDIIRSKTIGKVTIGNSGTGVKLVSCVLYCG